MRSTKLPIGKAYVGKGTETTVPETVAFTGTTNGSIDDEAEAESESEAEMADSVVEAEAVGVVEVGVGVEEDSAGGVYLEAGGVQVDVGGGVQVEVGGVYAGVVDLGFLVVGAGACCPSPPPPLNDQDIWNTPAPGSCFISFRSFFLIFSSFLPSF